MVARLTEVQVKPIGNDTVNYTLPTKKVETPGDTLAVERKRHFLTY